MKVSKILFSTFSILLLATCVNVSFAKTKNHDGEIVAYMKAINNAEVNVSKVAKDKKVDNAVMDFADMMIKDHTENLEQVNDLSSKINVAADETASVKKFEENNSKDLTKLSKLDDGKFQKEYIKAMIKGHEDADKMLTKFVKEANNPELHQYLVDTKKAVEQHLAAAKKLS